MKAFLLLLLLLSYGIYQAEDSLFIKLHFIYGSKPARKFKSEEQKWFGGRWGGHVGIENDSAVISFVPYGPVTLFPFSPFAGGAFIIQDVASFWSCMGYPGHAVKQASIRIPITPEQKIKIDSLVKDHTWNSPYNYSFFGIRCTSASFDILKDAGITKPIPRPFMIFRYFYPRLLRHKFFRLAYRKGWLINMQGGSKTRIWDFD